MSLLRTDKQVDALEILKLIIETVDYYRAMAELLIEEKLDGKLLSIAKERETYVKPFQKIVEQLHELPAEPDPDKELAEEIVGKITKLLSTDTRNAILDKCLHKEDELAELVNNTVLHDESHELRRLLDSLSKNIELNKKTLLNLEN